MQPSNIKGKGRAGIHGKRVCRSIQSGNPVETTILFGDFRKSGIAATACNRVKEKSIEAAHKVALEQMESLIAEAQAFYSNQAAQRRQS